MTNVASQTAIGQLPQDWTVAPLSELCSTIIDGTHFTPRYVENGVPFYSVENVTADDFENTKFISVAEHELLTRRCRPERGDILLTRIGSLGETKLIDWEVDASIYVSLALLKLRDNVSPHFIYRYTKSQFFVRDVEKRSLLNAAPKKINMGEIGDVPIPVPPTIEEQNAIADALRDIDDLIASLDALIAKKHDIKQASMRELLTGTSQLPGFDSAWLQTPLGALGKWRGGATPSMRRREFWEGGHIPWASSADVRIGPIQSTASAITDRAVRESSTTLLPAGSIAIVTRSGILRRFLPVGLTTRPTAINQDIKAVFPNPQFTSDFVFHAIVAASDDILASCMKSGTTVESIELPWLKRFEIAVPDDREEQAAIAGILTHMDQEIDALTTKQAKFVELKEGMMQQLLTGRIRLL